MVKLKIISDKENATDVIKSAISAEIKRMEIGLNRTNREIKSFEEKHLTPFGNSQIFIYSVFKKKNENFKN